MPRYEIEGSLHFITSVTNKRVNIFMQDWACKIVVQAMNFYIHRGDVVIIGYMIMPDHLHVIADFNPESSISKFMINFHKFSAREIIKQLKLDGDREVLDNLLLEVEKRKHHQYQLWEGSSYDFNIISYNKLYEELNYMHNNPIRKNLVSNIEDYPYSSWHNYNDSKIKLVNVNIDYFTGG